MFRAFRFIFSGAVLERCDFAGGERQAEKRSNSRKFSVKWRCAFNMIRISWFYMPLCEFTALNKLKFHRNVVSQLITICPSTHRDIFQVIKLHSNVISNEYFTGILSPLSAFSLHFLWIICKMHRKYKLFRSHAAFVGMREQRRNDDGDTFSKKWSRECKFFSLPSQFIATFSGCLEFYAL